MSARVVGADGTKGGWVIVALNEGRFERAALCTDVDEIIATNPDAAVVALDIPIGELMQYPRKSDLEARKFIPGRGASVFPTPIYAALTAEGYVEACRISEELTGKKLSRQSWELRDKIIDATETARMDERVIEVHPEVSFAAMNGGQPLPRKKSYNGLGARVRLLRDAGIELPDTIEGGDVAPADDVIDAAVAAWSADRKRRGDARPLPDPVVDFAIWY
jgi:predicted RNase H-like nuclease